MQAEIFVLLGGLFNLVFAIFHVFFWKIFDWQSDLQSLTTVNRGIMQALNVTLTCALFIFAYIELFHTSEMISSALGNTLLALIGITWLIRALGQIVFFGLKHGLYVFLFVLFIGCGIIHLLPVLI